MKGLHAALVFAVLAAGAMSRAAAGAWTQPEGTTQVISDAIYSAASASFDSSGVPGTNFTVFNRQGFFDAEVAERWIAGARPNETPVDLTLGLHVLRDNCVLLQSFNIIAGGDARPPYTYYRSHKLELSWVTDLGHGISIQSGSYFSPAGQNALDEKGAQISLWVSF
jgi:hypothetical protein